MILTIERPGSLLPVLLRREITAEEADAIAALLDPPDPQGCDCGGAYGLCDRCYVAALPLTEARVYLAARHAAVMADYGTVDVER